MSHSTTATTAYNLSKYSKSYPIVNELTSAPTGTFAEWQHFTNPVIRLILDIKQTGDSGGLESVRLRVLWTMNTDMPSSGQQEVVFEDIDLFAFSNLTLSSNPKDTMQSLPLKAVYRESVVGIRYIHPCETRPNPVFRRFQVTFLSTEAATQFINSIHTVVPCKANPVGPAPPLPLRDRPSSRLADYTRSQFPSESSLRIRSLAQDRSNSIAMPPPQMLPVRTATMIGQAESTLRLHSQPPRIDPASTVVPDAGAFDQATFAAHSSDSPSLDAIHSSSSGHYASAASTLLFSSPTLGVQPAEQQYMVSRLPPSTSIRQQQPCIPAGLPSPLPDSSPPVSSDNPADASTAQFISSLQASLRQDKSIYQLPRDQLEQLVAEVLHEEGFSTLVENINALWRLKGISKP